MKKRILSLAMAACLALSMMLTLSACGKKNLEEYFNTDTMQKLVTSLPQCQVMNSKKTKK
ncbi:hypothetical protein [Flavonifractor plautii]|uniref:hypothetical protein n=1 Tax=Flavonifractor plautii TaxID=292800 RepID=UPI002331530A|nr:hypothetical protein [Flavonifractor plautii]MDB7892355.1 hypothetical protein [Flavonifractor plautii]